VGCRTRNVFKKKIMLRVVEPAMYLKEILCCGWYNSLLWCNGGYYLGINTLCVLVLLLNFWNICFYH